MLTFSPQASFASACHTNYMSTTYVRIPGKSFGLKFIANQSDLFRNLFQRQSELIRVNPKKVFNLVWCNSVKNQSVSIRVNPRLWIRMNPNQYFNPNESEVGILRIDSDWVFRLNHSDLGLIWIKNFIRIESLGLSLIDSDWILVRIKNLGLTRIETHWFLTELHQTRLKSFFGLTRIGAETDFGMNRNESDWFGMNFNPKLLPG